MLRALALLLAALSAFFVSYTIRLLVVTHFLTQTRAGGQGAFVGAAVFPLLAVAFGWSARRLWLRGRAA